MQREAELKVGVIGCGQWGVNHVRVFTEADRAKVACVADVDLHRLDRVRSRYPQVGLETDYRRLLDDRRIDAVVVATPTSTHASIALDALRAGKHVLVEKPFCLTSTQAETLVEAAKSADRVLMVGHVSLFNPGIDSLRAMIAGGALGTLHYLDAARTTLGPTRGDVNALYDLGTDEISICNHLLGQSPMAVSALGSSVSQQSIHDVCFATLQYENGIFAHLHMSWLNPRRVRTLTVVGGNGMAHWDELDPREPLRVFDRSVEGSASCGASDFSIPRTADARSIGIEKREPLLRQAEAFTARALDGTPCAGGAEEGLATVSAVEAANRSMQLGGALCAIGGVETGVVLKEGRAKIRDVAPMRAPSIEEIERVRRRCFAERAVPASDTLEAVPVRR